MPETPAESDAESAPEIAIAGDLTDGSLSIQEKLLEVPRGGDCLLYFDSPGGNPYTGISIANLILVRELRAVGVVTGECSSAALWALAACRQRFVTPLSVMLFHPMRWQTDENVQLPEATTWAQHFAELESRSDAMLARLLGLDLEILKEWMHPGRYVWGAEFAETGLGELIDPAAGARLPDL